MATRVYEVAGGWQAEDDELFMACFGASAEQAEEALGYARSRAAAIEERWASIPESDDELSEAELADIRAAKEEAARGESVRYVPGARTHA